MLQITIPEREYYDEATESFIHIKKQSLCLEHSLISISKWESTTNKPFLKTLEKISSSEFMEYIRCMTITPNVDPLVYNGLTEQNINEIKNYIEARMTATTFVDNGQSRGRHVITSELIYHWMITFNIPFECDKWHINRLLTLIRICSIKNNPNGRKMTKKQIYEQNRALNSARKGK